MSAAAAPRESRIGAARERARTAKQALAIVASLAFAGLVIVARHSHPGSTSSVAGDDGSATAVTQVPGDDDGFEDDEDGWSGWGSSAITPSQAAPQVTTRSS